MNRLCPAIAFVVVCMLLFSGCAETKYVPQGSYLLDRVQVVVADDTLPSATDGQPSANGQRSSRAARRQLARRLRDYSRQRVNTRWFGAVKLPLRVYSMSGRDSTRWLNRTLKSMGQAPVVFDSLKAIQSVADINGVLRSEGYFGAYTTVELLPHGRKMSVRYVSHPGQPYHIRRVSYEIGDTTILRLLSLTDSANWGLKPGQQLSVNRLDSERKRITKLLSDLGYHRFHKEYITFLADTVAHSRQCDLTLRLSPYMPPGGEVPMLHPRYRVGRVSYGSGTPSDTLLHLRRAVLEECTHLTSGTYFSATDLRDTYNHFGRLGAVKYTDISLRERPDTTLVDCDIRLQMNKPSTLSFQPEGTNTAGDLGAAASLTYNNRNLFRGSEQLSVELRGAYEAIRGLEGYRNQDFIEYSVESRLTFPRFLIPFASRQRTGRTQGATSEVSVLYDLQNRPEFHRRLLSGAWRYKWTTTSRRSNYQVDVLDLNYVFMPWISETFRSQYLDNENSRNAILRYNYEDLFITKLGFGYTYNNGSIAFKANVETSGNVLRLASSVFGADKDDRGHYRLFNIAYAQYAKADIDLTRSLPLDDASQVVLHVGFGIAYPYGNSTVLPFEKRYFSGGANSVRGWSVRSLGPGRFKGHDGNIDFINQTGDMKLDLNAEFRTHLFWKLGGALFIDAGNIWTLRNYKEQPGGQFSLSHALSDLAVSYGLGLRFNFDYFIVRFDLGMKAVNPAYEETDDEHYPLFHPRFSRDYAFHFAVGLPF